MVIAETEHPLRTECQPADTSPPPESLLSELTRLAFITDSLPTRSRILYQQLRKMLGQERLTTCLSGIQYLARGESAAGARLLAAFLDANTPSSRLLPKVSRFSSSRRVLARLATGAKPDAFLKNWQQRLAETVAAGEKIIPPPRTKQRSNRLDAEGPFVLLRSLLRRLIPEENLAEPDLERAALLAAVIRIDVDAYQERISQLAGTIDPFRVAAVTRVLPLLARADSELRDLRRLIGWIEAGDFIAAFARSVPRYCDALDDPERKRFTEALNADPELSDLAQLHANLETKPMPVPELAGRMARLMALGHQLVVAGERETELDLVSAALLAQQFDTDGTFVMPLTADLAEQVAAVLLAPCNGRGLGSWSLEGLEVTSEGLVLRRPQLGLGDRIWRHDLPSADESDPQAIDAAENEDSEDEDQEAAADLTTVAFKKMVLNNLDSTTIVLGFLRNPKVVAIPGLVSAVAVRTRSSAVLETIAKDRNLYTGFANNDVPLACLQNPMNIPVKLLRKFVHVKYVDRHDLKRFVKDKARYRREVVDEVRNYLDSLV
jgi:hypothetical protein